MEAKKSNTEEVKATRKNSTEEVKATRKNSTGEAKTTRKKNLGETKTTTAKERVKIELDDLVEKNTKLGNLLGKIKSDNWEQHKRLLDKMSNEQKKLLSKQYRIQKDYIKILEKRLKIWVEE